MPCRVLWKDCGRAKFSFTVIVVLHNSEEQLQKVYDCNAAENLSLAYCCRCLFRLVHWSSEQGVTCISVLALSIHVAVMNHAQLLHIAFFFYSLVFRSSFYSGYECFELYVSNFKLLLWCTLHFIESLWSGASRLPDFILLLSDTDLICEYYIFVYFMVFSMQLFVSCGDQMHTAELYQFIEWLQNVHQCLQFDPAEDYWALSDLCAVLFVACFTHCVSCAWCIWFMHK